MPDAGLDVRTEARVLRKHQVSTRQDALQHIVHRHRQSWQLLQGDPTPKSLLARDPFPDAPPRYLRAAIWHYAFSPDHEAGRWWTRERIREYLPPVSLDHPILHQYALAYGWETGD